MSTTPQNNKRIAKNTILLYFRMLFMMAVSLYTSRVILTVLGVEDFGIYNVVGGVVAMFGFINGCLSTVTQRYITFELGKGDSKRLHEVFCTCVILHILMATLILLLAETVGLWFLWNKMQITAERMNAAFWVFQCSVFSILIMIMSVPYNALIIAHEKMSAFAYISVLDVLLKLAVVYSLVWFKSDKLIVYAVLLAVIQLFIRFCYGIYSKRHFKESYFQWVWDKNLVKEMINFGSWSIFGNAAYVSYTQGVNILLNIFFGSAVNAARGISIQVQNAVNMFAQNFQTAVNPQITKSYAAGDYAYMHQLICRSSKFSFILLLLLSLPIMIETDFVLQLWLTVVPEHTVTFLRLMLCIVIIDSISNPLMVSASATGRIKVYHSVVGGLLLMIIPISYGILKLGCPPEAVFTVHLCLCILALPARLLIIRPLIHLSLHFYFNKVLLKCLSVTVVSLPIPILLNTWLSPSFISFLILTSVSVLTVAIMGYIIGLDKIERNFIKEKTTAVLLKIVSKGA